MSVVNPTYVLRSGDAWSFGGPLTDNSGNPLNLSGAAIVWQLDSVDFSKNIATLSIANDGIVVTNPQTATIAYELGDSITATIAPGTYYYTLRATLATGEVFTLEEGFINVTPDPV